MTVATGDTLATIAKNVYGDSALWYLIADANGLSGNSDLRVGQALSIPSRVGSGSNANTFTPYNASKVIGDTSPNLPQPAPQAQGGGGGCGGLGSILIIVVIAVVTIYTAGAAMAYFAPAATTASAVAAGTAATTMGLGASVMAGTAIGAGTGYMMAAAAIGAAVGSIAGQGMGMAMGMQKEFNWNQVGLSALSAGLTAGIGSYFGPATSSTPAYNLAGRAALANGLSQGIAVATGLQKDFSWSNVAFAAVGAGLSHAMNGALGLNAPTGGPRGFEELALRTMSGFASGMTMNALRGGKMTAAQVATDAFGNALGSSIAAGLSKPSQQESKSENITKKLLNQNLTDALQTQLGELEKVGLNVQGGLGGKVVAIGQNLAAAREGITGKDQEADFKQLNSNLDRDIGAVAKLAADAGLSEAQTAMLKNAFVLSRYDALNTANPDFQWTQLGIFAANTVRMGLAQSYTVADVLDTTALGASLIPGAATKIAGMGLREAAEVTRGMARDTLEGQIGVLKDVGSMALMHQTYGAEAMSTADFKGMSQAARDSFALQAQAEAARANGDTKRFYDLQTQAAVEMGRHEQTNLQSMWDKPSMTAFAKVNAALMNWTGYAPVRPDIYVGTNPANDRGYAVSITAPQDGREDLTVLENRVNIARNGFNAINAMRQTPAGNALIEFHQNQLGHSIGLVQPWKPSWKVL